MTDPTPLHRLADHWRASAERVKPKGMSGEPGFSHTDAVAYAIVAEHADHLEASLQAIDVEAAAREVAAALPEKIVHMRRDKVVAIVVPLLRSAFAAGQAQGWKTCPVSGGEHEFGSLNPGGSIKCVHCGILRSAVEPATPDSPSA